MKTKHLLTAICLPALFAACTADEFAESPQVNLNRKTFDLAIVNNGVQFDDASTKMDATEVGPGLSFSWTKSDVIGAAMMDGAAAGIIQNDNKVWVNYPFSTQGADSESSKFTTPSPVMVGRYFFYHQYKPTTARDVLKLEIEKEQVYQADLEKNALSQSMSYMAGISPEFDLVDGIEYKSGLELPVQFANLATPFKVSFKVKNAPKNLQITKVVLKKQSGNMTIGGTIDFSVIEKVTDIEDAATVATARDAQKVKVNDATIYASKIDAPNVAVVLKDNENAKGLTVKEDATTSVYMMVPCLADATDYVLTIYTNEGYYEEKLSGVKFESGKNQFVKEARVLDFDYTNGNVKQPVTFNIPSNYSWADALEYIYSHPEYYLTLGVNFVLDGDAVVPANVKVGEKTYKGLPNLDITVAGSHSIILTEDMDLDLNTSSALKLNNSGIQIGDADNMPTITLKSTNTSVGSKKITVNPKSTLNIAGTITLTDLTNKGNVVVNDSKALTISTGFSQIADSKTTINGALTITSLATVNGQINIATTGTLTVGATLTNAGEIVNFGKLVKSGSGAITNAANIIIKDGSVSDGTSGLAITNNDDAARIIIENVTTFSALETSVAYNLVNSKGAITTEVTDAKTYTTALNETKLSDITLAGSSNKWLFKNTGSSLVTVTGYQVIDMSSGKSISVKEGDLFVENGAVATSDVFKSITVLGYINLGVYEAASIAKSAVIKLPILNVAAKARLTLKEGITLNAKTSNSAEATILGIMNVEAGAKAYFTTATVGATDVDAAALYVRKGATIADAGAEFGSVTSTFMNYGRVQVESNGGTTDKGKVTLPTNMTSSAVFSGNADETLVVSQ